MQLKSKIFYSPEATKGQYVQVYQLAVPRRLECWGFSVNLALEAGILLRDDVDGLDGDKFLNLEAK